MIFDLIEGWYNSHRLHSSLGHLSPAEYETALAADEPVGSRAAELCRYLAREVSQRSHREATRDIEALREEAAEGGDEAHLGLGAVPSPVMFSAVLQEVRWPPGPA
ncbi:IS3 family transposase [Streptomyces koyangensis]|uniref:IS3 family transposase n=1 Tax=Streptomyces TaxID=1883 RepID=UPI00397FBAE7